MKSINATTRQGLVFIRYGCKGFGALPALRYGRADPGVMGADGVPRLGAGHGGPAPGRTVPAGGHEVVHLWHRLEATSFLGETHDSLPDIGPKVREVLPFLTFWAKGPLNCFLVFGCLPKK